MQNKRLRSHHARAPLNNVIHEFDLQLTQRVKVRELLVQSMLIAD
jgi:hypothetical protein